MASVFTTIRLSAQNLEFTNNSSTGIYPKFVIQNGKTTLTVKAMITVTYTWNQIPVNFDNSDGRSRYKMVVTQNMGSAVVTYEIFWMHMRSVNRYSGHIKSTTNFNNGSRPIERSESFRGKII
ncbi:hypothetical protein ACFSKL_04745 [Belliella marina]|uniref:Salivary secreted peptide n=1 Tax=Belliella marina TaxID=1644146 RepID=A0ABW4VJ15_9BACT